MFSAVSVIGNKFGLSRNLTVKDNTQPGWFSELSILAKKNVQIPVILTGGVKTAEEAESLLREDTADLIGVGRAMLQNQDWSVEALR